MKNGITRGFYIGIELHGRGAVVRDMLVDQNTYIGIDVHGQGAVVEHNQVVDTGGSTNGSTVPAWGVEVVAEGSTVSNNVVSGLTSRGAGEIGIHVPGTNSTVRGNVVSDSAKPSAATSYGIWQANGIAVNNTVSNFMGGIFSYAGIYAHNTAYNCFTPYMGGTAGAGNSP